jgi:hypothetical protein
LTTLGGSGPKWGQGTLGTVDCVTEMFTIDITGDGETENRTNGLRRTRKVSCDFLLRLCRLSKALYRLYPPLVWQQRVTDSSRWTCRAELHSQDDNCCRRVLRSKRSAIWTDADSLRFQCEVRPWQMDQHGRSGGSPVIATASWAMKRRTNLMYRAHIT